MFMIPIRRLRQGSCLLLLSLVCAFQVAGISEGRHGDVSTAAISPLAVRHPDTTFIPDAAVWQAPPIRPEGFQFEIQISSLGECYEVDRVRASIEGHNLGEHQSAVSKVIAAEWGYSFVHLGGQQDGAGRKIESGYASPPASRAEALKVIETFLHSQYIRGEPRPWASMNGHYPWHHYAAEFGFDQIGSEIGENINNYQWHIALTRGAARQYARPWFMDFSAWHGPGITDYCESRIWGEYSHPDHGHSMSLFERSLFLCYMAGAGQITAEAGGAIAFLTKSNDEGLYPLSPYGEVCKRLRDFSLAHPDVGIPCTPFGIVLDYYHGAYGGLGTRKAFGHFEYTRGDDMTWTLIDMIWPGGWEVMGTEEKGTLVNGPYGDTFDILLQNAPQQVLNSYPCLILSGDVVLSMAERERFLEYVARGGTLILNSAYLHQFPGYLPADTPVIRETLSEGRGRVVLYGPDFDVGPLDSILREELARHLPVSVSGDVHYLVNIATDGVLVTLMNHAGITKPFHGPPVIDLAQQNTAKITWTGGGTVRGAHDIKNDCPLEVEANNRLELHLAPGGICIVHMIVDQH